MINYFLNLVGTQKVEFDAFQVMFQVIIHVGLAQSKSYVVRPNTLLNVEYKQAD
jgi:hypothetical protein